MEGKELSSNSVAAGLRHQLSTLKSAMTVSICLLMLYSLLLTTCLIVAGSHLIHRQDVQESLMRRVNALEEMQIERNPEAGTVHRKKVQDLQKITIKIELQSSFNRDYN